MSRPEPAEAVKTSSIVTAVVALLLVIGIGASLINVYVNRERQRDLQQWEARLGLVADAKVEAVNRVLASNLAALTELAENASVQTYLWRAIEARDAGQTDIPQTGYLRNLLIASADRHGFLTPDAARVPANLPQSIATGLALLDGNLETIVTTPGLPGISLSLREAASEALETGSVRTGRLERDDQERVLLAFAVPVKAVLGLQASDGSGVTGVLVGIRDAANELYPALAGGAAFSQASETLLLERRGDTVVYLSPTRDGAAALRRSMPLAREWLAEAQAVREPGGFVRLDNYEGRPVLQVSRQISGQTWVLAQQVDAQEALREANARRRFLLTSLSLLLFTVAALAVAAWRHGSSVRARHEADEMSEQAARLHRQTELLHAITDNIDALTMLLGADRQILFTNQATADAVGCTIEDLLGKRIAAAFGPAVARQIQRGIEQARQPGTGTTAPLSLEIGPETRRYQASFIAVAKIGDLRDLVLVVLKDITELEIARAKHEILLRNLVSTLAAVIDLHDPYTAFHSARMAEVADELARELDMNARDLQVIGFAATLANIGKIMIPRELLIKTEALTEDEQKLLETHVAKGLELLHSLDFEGPVLSTIAQKQELLDGSGYPRGLGEEQMTLAGKVLAVANAFVALVSPRAYRQALPVMEALDRLMEDAGTRYDRHVVAALYHVAENRLDWSRWNRRQANP